MTEHGLRLRPTSRVLSFLESLSPIFMPPEEELSILVEQDMVLTNPSYPKSSAVKAVVNTITRWYRQYGKESAINLVRVFLIDNTLMVVRAMANGKDDSVRGNRRGEDQSLHVSTAPGLVEGDQQGQPSGLSCGQQGLRLVEGGGDEGSYSGSGADGSPPADAHRGDEKEGLSRRLVALELQEHEEDLKVFRKAYSTIQARVRTVADEGRFMKLVTWSGTTATVGLLELVIHNIEQVVEELKEMLAKVDAGDIPNLDEE